MKCKQCGNDSFYSIVKIAQYYDENGQPCGCEETTGQESNYVKCSKCGYKTRLDKLRAKKVTENENFK